MKPLYVYWLFVIALLTTSEKLFTTSPTAKLPQESPRKTRWLKGQFPKPTLVHRVEKITQQSKTTPPLRTLTMLEAVDISYRYKPNLLAYKYLVQASKIAEKAVWSDYLPRIALASGVNTDNYASTPHFNTAIQASQLIYNFAGPQESYKRVAYGTDVIKFQEETVQNDTRLQVEQAFLDCWKLQQQRESILALKNSSQETFKQAITQNRVQLLDKNDWLKQVETHSNDLSTIALYEDGTSSSQKQLTFLLGYSLNLDIKPKTSDEKNPVTKLNWDQTSTIPELKNLGFYHDLAIKNRPEIKEKQKLIEIKQITINLARYSRFPVFNLNASVVYDSYEADSTSDKTTKNIGISCAVPIFDQLVSDYQANTAEAEKLAAILNKQETVQAIKSAVEIAYYALSQEVTRFKTEKYRFERAKNEFELQKLQFKIGNISKVDFETAILNWSNEQYNWLNLRVNVEKQQQQLMHDCGYPAIFTS